MRNQLHAVSRQRCNVTTTINNKILENLESRMSSSTSGPFPTVETTNRKRDKNRHVKQQTNVTELTCGTKNRHATIAVMTGSSKDEPWIGNAIFFRPHDTQPGNDVTAVITSQQSSRHRVINIFWTERSRF